MSLHARVALFAAALAAVLAASTAGFISNEAVGASSAASGGAGRSLLQAKKDCPVNFEEANYTVITSRCKGPMYPPALCCQALKDLACPFTAYINDAQTTCAASMFSYINLYGKYPPGLFANTCKEGANGLECPEDTPQMKPGEDKAASSAATIVAAVARPVLAAVSAFLMLIVS
ncbi:GPI-anchored protein LLG1-like [Oryza glaberrima]|uniref:GPI-anchored protein LLG1-like domain-containing protein n=1 Tax=Oryza glaberrima TaxID=4538 RepID=I1QMR1_ORYGL|nr:GPI-anchored protein LLG1-like [Oryza glaberrima]